MAIAINGSGTITGISQGGLNDNIITQSELATTGVAGNGPTFSAHAATQSLSAATWTKVKYSNENWDTNNNYDPVTNYRFTPTVAGYYIINFSVNFGNATTANERAIALYKNGALYYGASDIAFLAGNTTYYMSSSCQVYFNGSTDYVEVYVFSSAASTSGPGADNKFQGVMVRAA